METINIVKEIIEKIIITDIEKAYANNVKIGSFTLIFCAIDFLGSLFSGKNSSRVHFNQFMKEFKSLSKYDGNKIYDFLRNGLVHNFTIKNNKYKLAFNEQAYHLKLTESNSIILNFEDFFNDFKEAIYQYFEKIKIDETLKNNIKDRMKKVPILAENKLIKKPGGFNEDFSPGFKRIDSFIGYGINLVTTEIISDKPINSNESP